MATANMLMKTFTSTPIEVFPKLDSHRISEGFSSGVKSSENREKKL